MYHTSRINQDDTSKIHNIHSHALSVAAVLKSCSREMDDELHADDNYEEKRGVVGVASWNWRWTRHRGEQESESHFLEWPRRIRNHHRAGMAVLDFRHVLTLDLCWRIHFSTSTSYAVSLHIDAIFANGRPTKSFLQYPRQVKKRNFLSVVDGGCFRQS